MMKTITCRQVEGECDKDFLASIFEQMANLSYGQGSPWEHVEPFGLKLEN